jgi:hypothetical protein
VTERRPWTISLRGVGRALLLLGLLGPFAMALALNPPDLRRLAVFGIQPERERLPPSLRKISYRLANRGTTVFRLSQPVSVARVITFPIVARKSVAAGREWIYGIQVDLLDGSGTVIGTRQVWSRSMLIDRKGKRRGPYRFYRNSDDAIALLDEVRITSPRPFVALRLQALSSDNGVIGIDARVFERKPLIESAAQSAFLRLDPEERARLAAPGAFAPEVLTSEERANIMRNQWRPVGPEGVEGRDYQMNVLYEEKDTGEKPDQSQIEAIEE